MSKKTLLFIPAAAALLLVGCVEGDAANDNEVQSTPPESDVLQPEPQALPSEEASADSDGLDAQRRVVEKILNAPDPEGTVRSLSPEELELFHESVKHLTYETVVSRTGPLSKSSPEVAAMGPEALAAAGCWYHYQYDTWKDVGLKTGDTWMQLNWCSNGSTIKSWSVTNYGGKGYLGNQYVGVQSMPKLNVGWEIRQAVQFHFNMFGAHAYPCSQVRGGATGLYSTRKTCKLN